MSTPSQGVGGRRSVIQVTVWDSPYLGNFMASQLVLADAVEAELGLATHLVLAEGARDQPWLAELARPHLSWSILPSHGRAQRRRHLERVAREHGAAIVHSHFTEADVEAVVAARRCRASCVWQMHTGFAAYSTRQRAKDLFKVGVLGKGVDRVIAVSDWVAALARRRGFPAESVVVLPNAIVLDRFDSLPDPKRRVPDSISPAMPTSSWRSRGGRRSRARTSCSGRSNGSPPAGPAPSACSWARSAWSSSYTPRTRATCRGCG